MWAIAHQGIPVSSQCSTNARRANVISENASRERERRASIFAQGASSALSQRISPTEETVQRRVGGQSVEG